MACNFTRYTNIVTSIKVLMSGRGGPLILADQNCSMGLGDLVTESGILLIE